MRLKYNAPITLTFSIVCTVVLVIGYVFSPTDPTANGFMRLFIVGSTFNPGSATDYFRLVSHCMGHANWQHLFGNFSLILILGPILEEKYGSGKMLLMIFMTAFITGVLHIFMFSNTGGLGASGIVFMFIILSSFTSFQKGDIPITFVLVVIIYLGKEIIASFEEDHISQFAHIMGGLCGGLFGFLLNQGNNNSETNNVGSLTDNPLAPTNHSNSDSEYMG